MKFTVRKNANGVPVSFFCPLLKGGQAIDMKFADVAATHYLEDGVRVTTKDSAYMLDVDPNEFYAAKSAADAKEVVS